MPKELNARQQTAATIGRILDFFYDKRIPASRTNTLGVPVVRMGAITGFRPGSRPGRPDIEGILPPRGVAILVEVKTGKDRLRPAQEAYFKEAAAAGAMVLVVKDFDDFMKQWKLYDKN